MPKFYVVCGYCGPDHYSNGDGAVLEFHEFNSATEVEAHHKEWIEEIRDDDDYSDITYRVFEGVERKIEAVQTVTEYKLK